MPLSAVKPQTGHLIGGAGAVNVAMAALALHNRTLPATLNLQHPDPECDLDLIRGSARESSAGAALALARGLEGQAVALALTRAA